MSVYIVWRNLSYDTGNVIGHITGVGHVGVEVGPRITHFDDLGVHASGFGPVLKRIPFNTDAWDVESRIYRWAPFPYNVVTRNCYHYVAHLLGITPMQVWNLVQMG